MYDVYDFVSGAYLPLDGSEPMAGHLDMDGYDIDNVVSLELNGNAAGAIVLDTALSATSVKGQHPLQRQQQTVSKV